MFPISYQLHHTGMVTKRNHLLGYEPLTKSEAWEEQAKRLNRCWTPMGLRMKSSDSGRKAIALPER
jgi:hypothetical protein